MMLTVRDHILQGNYPTTDRGWSPVPTRNGRTARIITAHGDDPAPLVGLTPHNMCLTWSADGAFHPGNRLSELDLLPPSARPATAADLGIAA